MLAFFVFRGMVITFLLMETKSQILLGATFLTKGYRYAINENNIICFPQSCTKILRVGYLLICNALMYISDPGLRVCLHCDPHICVQPILEFADSAPSSSIQVFVE